VSDWLRSCTPKDYSRWRKKARAGHYDDFKSDIAMPIVQLVMDLEAAGKHDLANRARNGEFDSTKEESEEWYAREGHKLLP